MGFLTRWAVALVLMAATFNPARWNFIAWARETMGTQTQLAVLFGLILLGGHILYLRATLRSIGGAGGAGAGPDRRAGLGGAGW